MKNASLLIFFAVLLSANALFAAVYESQFTGTYDWHTSSSWLDGVVPPEPLAEDDVVVINGDVTVSPGSVITNNGTILIQYWATLTFQKDASNGYNLTNQGNIFVEGDLLTLHSDQPAVFASVLNFGFVDIIGLWHNSVTYDNSGITLVQNGATFRNYEIDGGTCYPGNLINNMEVSLQGSGSTTGTLDNAPCGDLIGAPTTAGSCGPPHAVVAYINYEDRLQIRWSQREGSFGYRVGIQNMATGKRQLLNLSATSYKVNVAAGVFDLGEVFRYGALNYCTPSVYDLANLTIGGTFLFTRQAGDALSDGNSLAVTFDLYPNPSAGLVNLKLGEGFCADESIGEGFLLGDAQVANPAITVVISDLLGRELFRSSLTSDKSTIDLSAFETGTYLVTLHSKTAVESKLLQLK